MDRARKRRREPAVRGRGTAILAVALCVLALSACHDEVSRAPLVFSPDAFDKAVVGVPYNAIVTVYQHATPVGELSVIGGSLPPGLDLEHAAGDSRAMITGTPTQAGTYRFRVGAWCYADQAAGQRGDRGYTIVVDW